MKKLYQEPAINVINLADEDVLTASGGTVEGSFWGEEDQLEG